MMSRSLSCTLPFALFSACSLLLQLSSSTFVYAANDEQQQNQSTSRCFDQQDNDPYVYFVYYEGNECSSGSKNAVAVDGRVVGANFTRHGIADSGFSCAEQTACNIHAESKQCQDLSLAATDSTSLASEGSLSYNNESQLLECDPTNSLIGGTECGVLDTGGAMCQESSLYSNCHFSAVLQSELIANPDLVKNDNAANEGFFNDRLTVIHYSDEECQNVASVRTHLTGNDTVVVPSNEDVSCYEAMACWLDPTSGKCKDFGASTTIDIAHKISNSTIYACVDGECTALEPGCNPTPLYPNCFVQVAHTAEFLSNPAQFLNPSTVSSDGSTEDDDEDNDQTISSTGPSSSASFPFSLHFFPAASAVVYYLLLLLY